MPWASGLGIRDSPGDTHPGLPAQPRAPSLRGKGRAAEPPVRMLGSALSPASLGRTSMQKEPGVPPQAQGASGWPGSGCGLDACRSASGRPSPTPRSLVFPAARDPGGSAGFSDAGAACPGPPLRSTRTHTVLSQHETADLEGPDSRPQPRDGQEALVATIRVPTPWIPAAVHTHTTPASCNHPAAILTSSRLHSSEPMPWLSEKTKCPLCYFRGLHL